MEGPIEAPPSAGTSSKLVSFPESTWNNEEKKHPKPTTPTPRFFPFNLLNCFGTFFFKSRARKKPARVHRAPERKILRTSTISSLSLFKMESNIEATPYKWPHDSTFDPKTTALVIIDMQRDCEYLKVQLQLSTPLSLHFQSPQHHVCQSTFLTIHCAFITWNNWTSY